MQLLVFCSIQQIDGQDKHVSPCWCYVKMCILFTPVSQHIFCLAANLHYSEHFSSGHYLLLWFITEISMMPRTLMKGLELSFLLGDCLSFTINILAYLLKMSPCGSFRSAVGMKLSKLDGERWKGLLLEVKVFLRIQSVFCSVSAQHSSTTVLSDYK